jgi:hypothetical protein
MPGYGHIQGTHRSIAIITNLGYIPARNDQSSFTINGIAAGSWDNRKFSECDSIETAKVKRLFRQVGRNCRMWRSEENVGLESERHGKTSAA